MSNLRWVEESGVRGYLHSPSEATGDSLVLAHGAGLNCQSPLLVALAEAFSAAGIAVLRIDLPFRQIRPHGPPMPASAARDREGIAQALEFMRPHGKRLFAGGHSYGGRQTTMLLAERPQLAAGLLLLSYPLHPPKRPKQPRTAHFPNLRTAALFVHGTRDGFGSPDELTEALKLIPAATRLLSIEGAGHELLSAKNKNDLPQKVVHSFQTMFLK
jgi:predicted alpha/beta-hydrolase family hydrolase